MNQWIRVVGLIVICSGLATFTAAAQSVQVTASEQVSEHWRGVYDILVRPQTSVSSLETQTGMVEGNYLGTPGRGISMAQYETVSELAEVEVAAPVAAIGYLHNETGHVSAQLPLAPGTLYRYATCLKESSGSLVDRKNGYFYAPLDCKDCLLEMIYPWRDIGCSTGEGATCYVDLANLPVVWTMMAGIDPVEEEKLIHLSSLLTDGSMLEGSSTLKEEIVDPQSGQKAVEIPLLISSRAFTGQQLSISLESFTFASNDLLKPFDVVDSESAADQAMASVEPNLDADGHTVLFDQLLSLDEIVLPMSGRAIMVRPGQSIDLNAGGFFSSASTDLLLYPGAIQYNAYPGNSPEPDKVTLQVSSLGDWQALVQPGIAALAKWAGSNDPYSIEVPEDAPQYRSLQVVKPNAFTYKVVGTYAFDQISASIDPLSYVPLGIYEPPTATLRYDQAGDPVAARELLPGLNPGGFIPAPPLALTTLDAARFILGSDDVINAIRVRVKDVTGYSPENVAKVEQVAAEIVERTGLHVDIVAGTSPQRVLVYVPGTGFAEEQWAAIGSATRITSGINSVHLFLFSFLLLASFLFVANESQLMILFRRKEIGLLKALGWHDAAIEARMLQEWVKLGLIGSLISAMFSLALILALGYRPLWWTIVLGSLLVPTLYILSSFPFVMRSVRILPAVALNQQDVAETGAARTRQAKDFGIRALVVRSLFRRKARAGVAILVTAVAAALSVIFLYSILYLQKMLQITLLGEVISISLRTFHIVLGISVVFVGLLVVLEVLLLSVLERRNEFALLQALGWQSAEISQIVAGESILLCGIGGLLGSLAGMLICRVVLSGGAGVPWGVILAVVAGYLLMGVLLSIYPAWIATRPTLLSGSASTTRSEGKAPLKASLALNRPYFYAALLLALLVVIGLGGNRQILRSAIGTGGTPQPTLTTGEKRFDPQQLMRNVQELAAFGPRFAANTAEKQAADYIAAAFSSVGLQVERQPVPLKALRIYDGNGNLLFQLPGANSAVASLAVDFRRLTPFVDTPVPIAFKGLDDPWPDPAVIAGKALMIEQSRSTDRRDAMEELLARYEPSGFPFAFAVTVVLSGDEERQTLLQTGNKASLDVSETISGVLQGSDSMQQQLWVTARYDSEPGVIGADDSLSGVSVMLELARVLSGGNPAGSYRFVSLPGTFTGLNGGMAFLLSNSSSLDYVEMLIDLNRLGNWDRLTAQFSFDGNNEWNKLRPEDQAKYRQDGQYPVRGNWQTYVDLSQSDPLAELRAYDQVPLGLGESPDDLVNALVESGKASGEEILEGSSGCLGYFSTFLSRNLPVVALCGVGNDLSGTQYDDASNVNPIALQKAAGIVYSFIQSRMRLEP